MVSFIVIVIGSWTYISNPASFDKVNELQKKSQTQSLKIDNWKTYNNPDIGFSFKYPANIRFLKENEYKEDSEKAYIKLEIKDIGKVEDPMDFNMEDAMKNIQALSSGEFGLEHDFPFTPSKTVKTVGFLFAQDFLVLTRFEICDVTLERKLLFYFNNKQILLTLYAPVELLLETMPAYFTTDTNNCGDDLIWNQEKQTDFYNNLKAGNASPVIQKWFNQFDEISETIIFAHR